MNIKNRHLVIISSAFVLIMMCFNILYVFNLSPQDFLYSIYGVMPIAEVVADALLIAFLLKNNRRLAIIPCALKVVISLMNITMLFTGYDILLLASEAVMLFVLLSSTVLSDKIDGALLKCIWFAPAVIWLVGTIIEYIVTANSFIGMYYGFDYSLLMFVRDFSSLSAHLMIGLWASAVISD